VPLIPVRWLATGGAVVLAGAVGVALLLQNGGSACAAPPSSSTAGGKATFYDLDGGTGNCSFPSAPTDDLFVALGPSQYAAGASCGSYLAVTGPKGTVRVKVIDSCPECEVGHLDLSRTAFNKIADEVQGVVPIKYRTVTNPSTPGPLSVRIKEGSSQYWFAALIDNHANRLSSVTVNGRTATRADYNYWIIDGGAGSGPFTVKVTDVLGHTATLSKIKLSPGVTQKTSVRLTGGTVTKKPTPSAKPKPKPKPKPKTTVKASPTPAAALIESTTIDEAAPLITEPPLHLAAGAAGSCGH
jgi:expansin (peptidoglycan-binding protein)